MDYTYKYENGKWIGKKKGIFDLDYGSWKK